MDRYYDLRYVNRQEVTEVGTDDLPAIEALAKAVYERLPPDVREVEHNLYEKVGRILLGKKDDE